MGIVVKDSFGSTVGSKNYIDTYSMYLKLEANTKYYIEVRGNTDNKYNISYQYNEDKEGDTTDTAYTLTEGASAYQTTLCSPDDMDYYTFTPLHSGKYDIKLTRITCGDNDLHNLKTTLYGSQGESLKSEDNWKNGSTSKVTYELTKGTEYKILVSSDVAATYSIAAAPSMPFTDVSDTAWYYNAVVYAFDNSIMNGTGTTTFSPSGNCTRAMMVKILYNAAGEPDTSTKMNFADVSATSWYYKAVRWAYGAGITSGRSDTIFDPNAPVTRQEMAAFLVRYADYKGYSTSERADISKFSDSSAVSGWARGAVQWANANGIINGKGGGRLDPTGTATRAEVAQMIMNFQNKFGK